MSDDPDSRTNIKPSTATVAAGRQSERAEALRANLVRRKAQARSRSETHDNPRPKPPTDA
jgi:hypothetical protein